MAAFVKLYLKQLENIILHPFLMWLENKPDHRATFLQELDSKCDSSAYLIATWKRVTVQFNCIINVQFCAYAHLPSSKHAEDLTEKLTQWLQNDALRVYFLKKCCKWREFRILCSKQTLLHSKVTSLYTILHWGCLNSSVTALQN